MARYTFTDSGWAKRDNWMMGEWLGYWSVDQMLATRAKPEEIAAYIRAGIFGFWDKDTWCLTKRKPGFLESPYHPALGFSTEEEMYKTCPHFDIAFQRTESGIFFRRGRSVRRYDRRSKEHIPSELRWAVWERDNFTCQKCGSRRHLSVDHIHPESAGGKLSMSNLQTLCRSCNSSKGNKIIEVSVA